MTEERPSGKIIDFQIIELSETMQTAFEREREIADIRIQQRASLNTRLPSGKPPKMALDLYYYDLAFLISIGLDRTSIVRLYEEIYEESIHIDTISKHIDKFFHSWNDAQKELLRPSLEDLFNKDKYYNKIEATAKIMEFFLINYKKFSGRRAVNYFYRWITGKEMLTSDSKKILQDTHPQSFSDMFKLFHYNSRYVGYPWKTWIKWAIEGKTYKDIQEYAKISRDFFYGSIFNPNGGYLNIQKEFRVKVAIDLLLKGKTPKEIWIEYFKYEDYTKNPGHSFFRDLFPVGRLPHGHQDREIDARTREYLEMLRIGDKDFSFLVRMGYEGGWAEFLGLEPQEDTQEGS